MKIKNPLGLSYTIVLCILLLSGSVAIPGKQSESVRTYTRNIEFDFLSWTLDALGIKLGQISLGTDGYINIHLRPKIVLDYLDLVQEINTNEAKLSDIYANPDISEPYAGSAELRGELALQYTHRDQAEPLAEEILQQQIASIVADAGLALGGQTIPPVLFHISSPPLSLIVSPRDVIRQDSSISISPELTIDQISELERTVDQTLGVSSIVVGIGGIGLYPTMVMETSDINWLVEVIAHEWVHNYLTLRPLGINYTTTPEMRAMNETVAGLTGKELKTLVVARYYPEFLPPAPVPTPVPTTPESDLLPEPSPEIDEFDFNAEMHITRVEVDRMLAEGKIVEAEEYMELRRRYFWENGYHIRKLNQAYFAFHGAYADQPGGAAGATEDPIGEAVRALRANSSSLADFLNRISWMWSYEQLQKVVSQK